MPNGGTTTLIWNLNHRYFRIAPPITDGYVTATFIRTYSKVPKRGLEPPRPLRTLGPEPSASANSATWAAGA